MSDQKAVTCAGVCDVCGADLHRDLQPFEVLHRRTSDALDEAHLSPGAEHLTVNVTRAGRVEMNRIRREQGLNLNEQIRQALDVWLALQRGAHARGAR